MIPEPTEHSQGPSYFKRKLAGVMAPLFSIRTEDHFGIGEILDLIPFIDWMTAHHLSILQLLPIYETSPQETSPYQALSSFAFDPVYLSLLQWDDIQNNPKINGYLDSPPVQRNLGKYRSSPRVCFEQIRKLKTRMFHEAFDFFKKTEWDKKSKRAASLQSFIDEKSHWLDHYALFRLLKDRYAWSHWLHWPKKYRNCEQMPLQKLIIQNEDKLLFIKYLQWALWEQWRMVRKHAKKHNVLLMGDMPFLLSYDSADVWANQDTFSPDVSIGAPPDAFSASGQNWGLPFFSWNEMKGNDYRWWRSRISEAKRSYDIIRLDHAVGFFRVWVMPKGKDPYFDPATEDAQIKQGRDLLKIILQEADALIPIAEDLGLVPVYVRRILDRMGIAGIKVLRWEKANIRYKDPKEYPFISLATTGTHDTTTLRSWWEAALQEDKENFLKILDSSDGLSSNTPFSEGLHRMILDRILGSGSALVILPIQDILGQKEQINIPATVGPHNWRYRMPAPLSTLGKTSPYKEKLETVRTLIDRHQRNFPPS